MYLEVLLTIDYTHYIGHETVFFFFFFWWGQGVPMCLLQMSTKDLSLYFKKKMFSVTLIFIYLLNKVELLFMFIDYFPWWVTADVLHHFFLTGFLFTGIRDICELEEIGQVAIYDTHIQLFIHIFINYQVPFTTSIEIINFL